MVILALPDAQRDLPTLAAKALEGEDVLITVGEKMLRLTRAAVPAGGSPARSRSGRGSWKGRVTIPDTFYAPWDAEDIGEGEA
jgi:hypothetical protein